MASKETPTTGNGTAAKSPKRRATDAASNPPTSTRSGPIAEAGVHTGDDFANLMSALMSDVLAGSITPMVANATVNAGGKLLKAVELQYKYGSPKATEPLVLVLAPGVASE